jgi:hypothetical protein
MESAVKTVVQTRLKMVKAPQALTESISQKIHQIESEQAEAKQKHALARILALPIVKPMLVFVLIGGAIFAVTRSPLGSGPVLVTSMGSDLLTQSISNFHAVVAGLMQPQVVSDRAEQVREFLSGKTDFPVEVPALDNCILVGGSANEYHGIRLAHVVYKHGGQVIYMFEAPYDRVIAGDGLALPDDAKQQLATVGSFSRVAPGGDTIILWVLGNTLCVAVSRIDRKELTQCFASENAPGKIAW